MADTTSPQPQRQLGTFLGVYTPTILTILGVIMYLRTGWLVGHLGLLQAIGIVVLSTSITLITTVSFSSIATNIRVGGGGAYFIVSRSLGQEIGGAVGIPLFLSQALSVTLYAYGFAEALQLVWPGVSLQVAAFVIVVIVGAISIAGARFALKTQVPILIMVAGSIVALIIGAVWHGDGSRLLAQAPSGEISFWIGFAVFFPAVTGVMAGLGLSGDLKEPERALPRGSILAVLTGLIIYLALPFFLAMGADQESLQSESLIWTEIALGGTWLVVPGLLGAIFSSAVGSMLGAPRTLQAMARDRILPRFLAPEHGTWFDLVPAYILSLVIALAAVTTGGLNEVAPLISMFFLAVYGTVNIAAAFERLSGDPSWRARIRVPWALSLMGGLACAFAMLLINPGASLGAMGAVAIIWLTLNRRERRNRWGDARRGIYESLIRWALIKLSDHPMSARNWRPHVLVFVSDAVGSLDMVRFASWFSQGRGIVTVCHLREGISEGELQVVENEREMRAVFEQEQLVVFPEFEEVTELVEGIVNISQANGLAGLSSNTVLVGWPDDTERLIAFLRAMKRLERYNKSFILARTQPRHLFPREGGARRIHIWWGGLQNNSDLMILLAHLLTNNREWRDAQVEVISVASNPLMRDQTQRYLDDLIPEFRIKATTRVILRQDEEETIRSVVRRESRDADVVFFGLASPDDDDLENYTTRIEGLSADLPVVFFVRNASLFSGQLLAPVDDEQPLVHPRKEDSPDPQE